jgi:hypothetical protein
MTCQYCQGWEEEATREPASDLGYRHRAEVMTKMTCPVCDRDFIGTERIKALVACMGNDWWAPRRAEHASK